MICGLQVPFSGAVFLTCLLYMSLAQALFRRDIRRLMDAYAALWTWILRLLAVR